MPFVQILQTSIEIGKGRVFSRLQFRYRVFYPESENEKKQLMIEKIRGWTLLELMVVLAVAGITLSLAVPSFQGMIARNRLTTKINDFLVAVNSARSEAGKIGGTVSVQAVIPEGGIGAANEFGPGWCVVSGNPGNCDGRVIRRFDGLTGDFTINSKEGEDVTSLQFDALGGLANTNNATRSFDFCTQGQQGRRVFITLIGRSKSHRPDDPDPIKHPEC